MSEWIGRLLLSALAGSVASNVAAHAELERAVPAASSAVHFSPPRVTLWFSQRLEPRLSKIRVLNAKGQQIDNGDAQVDSADAKQLSVSLPKLAPGSYRVRWRVLSVDSHVSDGNFTFSVGP
jgi:methionine-rich copper-binding protein CopC